AGPGPTMDATLLGYLLNALDPAEHRAVERRLEADPAARERLEALRPALEPLALDQGEPEPPPPLAAPPLARIAEQAPVELPRAPADHAGGAVLSFWRRADVLVAACLLLTFLGLLVPWFVALNGRGGAAQVQACQDNLRRFYAALKTYSDTHQNRFPDVAQAAAAPRNVAGMVVPMLRDAGAVTEPISVRCPANGSPEACPWSLRQLREMAPEQFRRHAHSLASCYAYSLGYRGNDAVIGPRFEPDKPNHRLPIMADCPPADPTTGNSLNHGGAGQNVLFLDGHVEY